MQDKKKKILISSIIIVIGIIIIISTIFIYKKINEINFFNIEYQSFVERYRVALGNRNIGLKNNFMGEKIKEDTYRFEINEKIILYATIDSDKKINGTNYAISKELTDEELKKYIGALIETIIDIEKLDKVEVITNKLIEIVGKVENETEYSIFSINDVKFSKIIDDKNITIFIEK